MPLEWKVWRGETNGVKHAVHISKYHGDICPNILEADDKNDVTLIINGYQFSCESVEAAKVEAEDRLRNNRGIYLQFI